MFLRWNYITIFEEPKNETGADTKQTTGEVMDATFQILSFLKADDSVADDITDHSKNLAKGLVRERRVIVNYTERENLSFRKKSLSVCPQGRKCCIASNSAYFAF